MSFASCCSRSRIATSASSRSRRRIAACCQAMQTAHVWRAMLTSEATSCGGLTSGVNPPPVRASRRPPIRPRRSRRSSEPSAPLAPPPPILRAQYRRTAAVSRTQQASAGHRARREQPRSSWSGYGPSSSSSHSLLRRRSQLRRLPGIESKSHAVAPLVVAWVVGGAAVRSCQKRQGCNMPAC
jgi:hypothetical protein